VPTGLVSAIQPATLVTVATSDGLSLAGAYYRGGARSDVGLLFVHGFTGTYDGAPVGVLARSLAERGFSALSVNMRDAGCCSYTTLFEDNATDIDAGVRFLASRGARQIVVVGHSLGANRVTYYRAQIDDPAVGAVVLLAGVGNIHQVGALLDVDGQARAALEEAFRRLAENDRLDDLLEVTVGTLGTFHFTPASLVSNGGPDTNSDLFKWLPAITVPVLIIHAANDEFSPFQRPDLARESAARSARADLVYMEGADHVFSEHEKELVDVLDAWLARVLPGEES
jgi:pimeloyl-ACP methyl ester carboxylesterase